MNSPDGSETRLRSLFERLHEGDDPLPFRSLVAAPRARRALRLRWALAPVALALAAVLVWTLLPDPRGVPLDADSALTLAESLSSWQAPLDFLLDAPGAETLGAMPSFVFLDNGDLPSATWEILKEVS